MFSHGTIIRTGITCKKIRCDMRGGLMLKMLKYLEIMSNIFEFSHAKEIVKS